MKKSSILAVAVVIASTMASVAPVVTNAAVTNTKSYQTTDGKTIIINRDADATGNISFLIDTTSLANVKIGLNEVQTSDTHMRSYFYTDDGKTLLVGKKTLDYKEFNFDNITGTTTGFTGQANDNAVMLQSGNVIHFSNMGAISSAGDITAKFEKAVTPGWYKDNTNSDNKLHWYYTEDGTTLSLGEKQINGSWYFLNPENGFLDGNGWVTDGLFTDKVNLDKSHYYNTSGKRTTGWFNSQNVWLHLNDNGLIETGWKKINGSWYLFNSTTGIMSTGWHKENNTWYYLDETSGKMVTGWKQVNHTWYLFGNNGTMQTGWQKVNGSWYYLNNGGDLRTGWLQSGSNWYYLKTDGSMKTGWLQLNNKWYFLKTDGSMLTSNFKLNGVTYTTNSSGECSW